MERELRGRRYGGGTQLDLALIARFAFDQRHAGSAEHAAAQVILEGLAALCGLVLDTPHQTTRSRYAQLYLHLSRQPSAHLREAARRLWEALFRSELPTLRELSKAR